MELETQDILVQKCRSLIEEALGWGNSEEWTTQDFDTLSQKIMVKTHVQLSVITLKRMWGRIRYDSKPTITTLNTLAQFIGFENWRTFKQHHALSNGNSHTNEHVKPIQGYHSEDKFRTRKRYTVFVILGVLLASAAIILYFTSFDTPDTKLDSNKFQFSSKKVVDLGVPNTVIFDYDVTAAKNSDSIFIQQSWDKRLSQLVARDQRQHTSIYYHPGFFQAKLRINDQVVQEHNLLIKSQGWLPLIDLKPVPVYFKQSAILNKGFMGLSIKKINESNIPLQPNTPWIGYYNVGDFGNLYSDDLIFETELKNEYNEGAAACQHSEVHVLFEGAAMVMPLCVPGCVAELSFADMSGKKLDLSALGVNFSDWVNVRFEVRDTLVQVYINRKKAFDLKAAMKPVRLVGLIYRFQGTGSVNFIKISRHQGEIVYEENFD